MDLLRYLLESRCDLQICNTIIRFLASSYINHLVHLSLFQHRNCSGVNSSTNLIRYMTISITFHMIVSLCSLKLTSSSSESNNHSKKSASNSRSCHYISYYTSIRLSSIIRHLFVPMRSITCLTCIRSSFSSVSIILCQNRVGISCISSRSYLVVIICGLGSTYAIGISSQVINPSSAVHIYILRAVISSIPI